MDDDIRDAREDSYDNNGSSQPLVSTQSIWRENVGGKKITKKIMPRKIDLMVFWCI